MGTDVLIGTVCLRCSQSTDSPMYLMGEGPYCMGCYLVRLRDAEKLKDDYRIDDDWMNAPLGKFIKQGE